MEYTSFLPVAVKDSNELALSLKNNFFLTKPKWIKWGGYK